jgi:pyrimidine 5'-nucleotidase
MSPPPPPSAGADAGTSAAAPLSPRSLHPPGDGPFNRPSFTHVLLDLDDTLYREHRVAHCVRAHIHDFVVEHLNVPRDDAERLTYSLYVEHGTTMAGLAQAGHALDPDHWHERVHAPLRYEELLARDESLVQMLRRLTTPKFVFTNADKRHMDVCLRLLGATTENVGWASEGYYFENVQRLGAERGLVPDAAHPQAGDRGKGFLAKPSPALFRMVAEHCGAPSPRSCVFVDDSVRNCAAARSVGMFTVLVGRPRSDVVPGADLCVESVLELPEVLPELFDGGAAAAEVECGAGVEASAVAVPIRVVAG